MKALVLTVALIGIAGCAENATTHSGAAASANTPTRGGNTPYQDIDIPAQPAAAQIAPSEDAQQPATATNHGTNQVTPPPGGAALPPYTPSRSMPSGNTVQPGGAPPVVPGSSARNPGNVPPTVQNGGNTAGTLGR